MAKSFAQRRWLAWAFSYNPCTSSAMTSFAGRLAIHTCGLAVARLIINLVYRSRRHLPTKICLFTEFLIERFAKLEPEAKRAGQLG